MLHCKALLTIHVNTFLLNRTIYKEYILSYITFDPHAERELQLSAAPAQANVDFRILYFYYLDNHSA